MKKSEVLNFLSESGLSEVEEIKYKSKILVVKFYYDFDKEELEAAKAYANEESDYDAESKDWLSEYVLPYLNDLATDNVGEMIEEAMEEFDIEGQYAAFDIDLNNYAYNEFIAVFTNQGEEVELDDVMDDLDL